MDTKAVLCLLFLLGAYVHLSTCHDTERLFRRDVTDKPNEQADGESTPISEVTTDKPTKNDALTDPTPDPEAEKMSNDIVPSQEDGDLDVKKNPKPPIDQKMPDNEPNPEAPKPLPMFPQRFNPYPNRPSHGWYHPNFDNMPLPQPFGYPTTLPSFYPPWNIPTSPSLEYPVYDVSPGGFASASSFVSSGGPGDSTSLSTNLQAPGFATRGAYPSSDDAPKMNSFENPSGGPSYPQYSAQGPGSSFASSSGNAGFPKRPVPPYNNGMEFQNFLQQYFDAMQEQQNALQAQLNAHFQRQQQAGGGSWATSGAYITNDQGLPITGDPNVRSYADAQIFPYSNRVSQSFDNGLPRGNSLYEISREVANAANQKQGPQFSSRFGESADHPYGGAGYTSTQFGPHSASASASIGPGGGFQSAQINPASPGIFSRFAEELPAPSGGSYGVFSSSSSSHGVGPDGQQKSFKSATTGVNDNGRISYKTVQDP